MIMKTTEMHLQELEKIRDLMERSSRFLSLSGLMGISSGIIAIAGAIAAQIFFRSKNIFYDEYYQILKEAGDKEVIRFLIIDIVIILFLAINSGFYFSFRRARKMEIPFWNSASKHLFVNLFIPLVSGGILCVILLFRKELNLIAPLMLIFYGLALVNAGKYTQYNVNYLGITEILTGLLAMIFIKYSFFFWILGFGIWHILYGSIFYFRYERDKERDTSPDY